MQGGMSVKCGQPKAFPGPTQESALVCCCSSQELPVPIPPPPPPAIAVETITLCLCDAVSIFRTGLGSVHEF